MAPVSAVVQVLLIPWFSMLFGRFCGRKVVGNKMGKAVFFDLDGILYDRDAFVTDLLSDQFEVFQTELDGMQHKYTLAAGPAASSHLSSTTPRSSMRKALMGPNSIVETPVSRNRWTGTEPAARIP